jgi:phosphoenolpyruvate-protein kinase (PTS system EI component)
MGVMQMNDNPIAVLEDDIIVLPESSQLIPEHIKAQIEKLKELSVAVDAATNKAVNAQKEASEVQKVKFGKRTESIEELQKVVKTLSDAGVVSTNAQKISFEFQSRLAEFSKTLLGLGVSNMAMNRAAIQQLKLQLEGASEEELTELARNEIYAVMEQLKAQEDMWKNVERLRGFVKQNEERIDALYSRFDFLSSERRNATIACWIAIGLTSVTSIVALILLLTS